MTRKYLFPTKTPYCLVGQSTGLDTVVYRYYGELDVRGISPLPYYPLKPIYEVGRRIHNDQKTPRYQVLLYGERTTQTPADELENLYYGVVRISSIRITLLDNLWRIRSPIRRVYKHLQ